MEILKMLSDQKKVKMLQSNTTNKYKIQGSREILAIKKVLENSLQSILAPYYLVYKDQTLPAKLDLDIKSLPKQKTTQNFTIDAQGFRKTKNENPPTWEMGVTS